MARYARFAQSVWPEDMTAGARVTPSLLPPPTSVPLPASDSSTLPAAGQIRDDATGATRQNFDYGGRVVATADDYDWTSPSLAATPLTVIYSATKAGKQATGIHWDPDHALFILACRPTNQLVESRRVPRRSGNTKADPQSGSFIISYCALSPVPHSADQ
ncbi:hypothetical protein E4U43_003639 [Claviceps pusilla]|uniref:Uncharacterized protein n=1 Tax=Claviceps pusilla TaxID=123648 RepID=A0A9P7N742_9HYPO|nr:hypothetical protein E4U43_003639 [Claviceps pusilla]